MRGLSCCDVAHARQADGFLEVMQLWQARGEILLLHWRGSTMLPLTQASAVHGIDNSTRGATVSEWYMLCHSELATAVSGCMLAAAS
jgi:hypothetical protein